MARQYVGIVELSEPSIANSGGILGAGVTLTYRAFEVEDKSENNARGSIAIAALSAFPDHQVAVKCVSRMKKDGTIVNRQRFQGYEYVLSNDYYVCGKVDWAKGPDAANCPREVVGDAEIVDDKMVGGTVIPFPVTEAMSKPRGKMDWDTTFVSKGKSKKKGKAKPVLLPLANPITPALLLEIAEV
jgi:hypothetical protein